MAAAVGLEPNKTSFADWRLDHFGIAAPEIYSQNYINAGPGCFRPFVLMLCYRRAGLAELADAPDSKSGDRKVV